MTEFKRGEYEILIQSGKPHGSIKHYVVDANKAERISLMCDPKKQFARRYTYCFEHKKPRGQVIRFLKAIWPAEWTLAKLLHR
jgi:hypothetical protein